MSRFYVAFYIRYLPNYTGAHSLIDHLANTFQELSLLLFLICSLARTLCGYLER